MSLVQQQEFENDFVMHTYGRKPVMFVRGEGVYLYDDAGKKYLDFLAGVGAVSVGHSNPNVVAALQEQAAKLVHVGNYFYVEGRGELAQKLSGLLATSGAEQEDPSGAWKVFFANSGAEANEGAIKLARKYGNEKLGGAGTIISAQQSFHGRTLAALAATGQEGKQAVFAPMPAGFIHVPINDEAALLAALDGAAANAAAAANGSAHAADGAAAHAAAAPDGSAAGSSAVCAVMLECVQGEAGVWPCSLEYLKAVRKLTAERNIALIIDEVQTGFYRTGTYPFSYQHAGIVPDIVSMAKGIGNGFPVAAFAACGEMADLLVLGEHGSTFGGGPLAIAAAHATLDELEANDAATQVAQLGEYFAAGLAKLPLVVDVRGKGLMCGVSLSKPVAPEVGEAALEGGLVINTIGDNTLRFLPPLVVNKEQIDEALSILQTILAGKVS
ncbi:MAG: acetylornithine/succinylornithine family transaminase [Coriobacteriia bacterium]|nr:acetylornithine/succinylornithine family transaminase [Coriobacteriia bacterium]